MPVWIVTLAKVAGSILIKLATALATEAFLKEMIIIVLTKIVKRTESEVDDRILLEAMKAWGEGKE